MNDSKKIEFKKGGFLKGWGIGLSVLITLYFLWRIVQVIAGIMPVWVAIVSIIGILYAWYRILSPVRAIKITNDRKVIFIRGLGKREVQANDIQRISPWLNRSKTDFVLKHRHGREFLFEDPATVAKFAQALRKMKPATLFYDGWALFNALLIGDLAPAILSIWPLSVFLVAAAKMLPQSATYSFVSVDVLVDTLVADVYLAFFQGTRDLLWAPVFLEFCLHQCPDFNTDPCLRFAFSTRQSFFMGLFGTITALSLVPL